MELYASYVARHEGRMEERAAFRCFVEEFAECCVQVASWGRHGACTGEAKRHRGMSEGTGEARDTWAESLR